QAGMKDESTSLPKAAVQPSGVARGKGFFLSRFDLRSTLGPAAARMGVNRAYFGTTKVDALTRRQNVKLRRGRLFATAIASCLVFGLLLAPAAFAAAAAAGNADRVTVPLSDPSRPAFIKAHLLNGGITVKGYEGKDVIVEARSRASEEGDKESHGMRRIPINSTGLEVEEESKKVDIGAASVQRAIDLTISVPVRSSLSLHTVNDGDISVSNVDGELDVNDVNGEVTLSGISGTVVAHALNGKVLVTFNRINPTKPMAFSSLNGDIDVTFPADLKASLVISSDRGEVFSDFDVVLAPRAPQQQQTTEDTRAKGGKYQIKTEKSVRGTINGGGQELRFQNFNGNIYIRKA